MDLGAVMSDRRAFEDAVELLTTAPDRGSSLCEPFVAVLPIDGAAISTLGAPFARETLYATDATAARFAEIQLDLGEGPCWLAASTRRPVLLADIRGATPTDAGSSPPGTLTWPALSEAIAPLEISAVYVFPLMVGLLTVGTVDLYSRLPGVLGEAVIADARTLATIAARHVLRRALAGRKREGTDDEESGFSRRGVHQATGIVLAQLNTSADDALLIIHGFAFSSGRTVREVAVDIVARRLDFSALDEA